MTAPITFDGLAIITNTGLERRESLSGSPIVVLEGPSLTGKTSFLDCLLFPLGHGKPSAFRRAVRDNVARVETSITLGTTPFRLVRHLRKRPTQIDVFETHNGERIERLDVTGKTGPSPSDFLFEHMGLAKIFQDVTVRRGSNARNIAFADYLRFVYADQMSVASDIHGYKQHDEERRLIFEIGMGLVDAEVHRAQANLDRIRTKIKALRTERGRNEDFVKATSKTLDELLSDLQNAQRSKQEADERIKHLRQELAKTTSTPRRPRDAKPKKAKDQVNSCPRCFTDLRQREAAADCCSLCLEPITAAAGPPLPPDDPPTPAGPAPDNPILQALLEATEARGQAREAIEKLNDMLKPHQKLAELQAAIEALAAEHDQARAELIELNKLAERGTERLESFEEMFIEFVKVIAPPYFKELAGLDFETYLPFIAGDATDVMAPGLRETANVVYRAALLRYALLEGHTYFPSALIIDSPQGQRGSADDDLAYAQRLYSMFLDLLHSRGNLPGFTGRELTMPKFQLIVVDNGIPSNVRGVRRIKLSYDNPLIPGVEYEAHELEDDTQELSMSISTEWCDIELDLGPHNCSKTAHTEPRMPPQRIHHALEHRDGWTQSAEGTYWTFTASVPMPKGIVAPSTSCRLLGTSIAPECGTVFPPSVKYFYDDDDPEVIEANMITGLDNPVLARTGIITAISLPADATFEQLLPRIESWRWPSALPRAGFGTGEKWYPPEPADFQKLVSLISTRPWWELTADPHEGTPLAYPFRKLDRWIEGNPACNIEVYDEDTYRYLVRATESGGGLLMPDAATVLQNIAYIESWEYQEYPRWLREDFRYWKHRTCPTCEAPPQRTCHPSGDRLYVHYERLTPGAMEISTERW